MAAGRIVDEGDDATEAEKDCNSSERPRDGGGHDGRIPDGERCRRDMRAESRVQGNGQNIKPSVSGFGQMRKVYVGSACFG